jgi:two-component system sensor kinase FixL
MYPYLYFECRIDCLNLKANPPLTLANQSFTYDEQGSNLRLQAIIETAIDSIILIDNKGIIELVNPAAANLFGYPPEEMMGKNVKMLMDNPHHDAHDGYLSRYQKTREARIIGIGREVEGMKKDGTKFPARLAVSEVKLENRTLFTGIIHDLTDVKLAEEKLRRYAAELVRSNRELQDFAYISSHDLQEPLRKIQAFGSRLETMKDTRLSEKGADYLSRMLNAASRMQRLINDLLSYSRVSTKASPFTPLDLDYILKGVLGDLEVLIEREKATVEYGKLGSMEGDSTQIRQLFQNLISNAIKFTPPDRTAHVKIWAEAAPPEVLGSTRPAVTIFVEDNGIGFNEQYLEKIFQIFQRLEGQQYEGSGVGLAICKRIAIRHGGYIDAQSTPGEGSVFRVTFPLEQLSQ